MSKKLTFDDVVVQFMNYGDKVVANLKKRNFKGKFSPRFIATCFGNNISATTDTNAFFEYVWQGAHSALFLRGRVRFFNYLGYRGTGNRDGSVLVAYGENNSQILADSGLDGHHQSLGSTTIIVIGVSPTWVSVVSIAVQRNGSDQELKPIYDMVEQIAPDKVQGNQHWKAKVRQVIQLIRKTKTDGKETSTSI